MVTLKLVKDRPAFTTLYIDPDVTEQVPLVEVQADPIVNYGGIIIYSVVKVRSREAYKTKELVIVKVTLES